MSNNCEKCGMLKDHEYVFYKDGDENKQTLNNKVDKLEQVKTLVFSSGRPDILMKCGACGTFYRYRAGYEFFPNGSENEEWLDRLSDNEADRLMKESV
jgi:uncharacterized Zn finger protein